MNIKSTVPFPGVNPNCILFKLISVRIRLCTVHCLLFKKKKLAIHAILAAQALAPESIAHGCSRKLLPRNYFSNK